MKFCQTHWTMMRKEVDNRAMTHLIARDGRKVTENMQKELAGENDASSFDPLMYMHWAIINNTMKFLDKAGGDSLAILAQNGPDDGHWCPICYMNEAHKMSCNDPKCGLDKERGYDWMIKCAAEDAFDRAKELGLCRTF